MNPLVASLIVLGYGLALPTGFRLLRIVRAQHRLAFTGHQIGIVVAGLGWAFKPSISMAVIHVLWTICTRLWYQYGTWRSNKPTSS